MTIYNIFESVINGGMFVLSDMEQKIEASWIEGKITLDEKIALLSLAAEKADDIKQIDVLAKLADLEQRVAAIESKGIVTWVSGMVTARGQTVLYDVDKDGVLDYCRYDGGRTSTASSPGKIEGWVKTDAAGNVTHTITKDENGAIILVPIPEPAPEPEPEPTPEPAPESGE